MDEKLRSCALICEYNPFHFGHAYQLSELKKEFPAVVCILGGNLTQRGTVAVADRYARAEVALLHGADVVFELPVPWCFASAEDFAFGGVSIAKRLGVSALAFSAESEEATLRKALQNKQEKKAELTSLLHDAHLSYPRAVEQVCGIPLADHPNDILGLCYLEQSGDLPAFVIRRNDAFLSSRAIRSAKDPLPLLPEGSETLYPFRDDEKIFPFLLASFRLSPEKAVYGMTPELFAAMKKASAQTNDRDSFFSLCTGKQFTLSRVRRALWANALQIPKSLPHTDPPYALLLAANETGHRFLHETRKTRTIPVVTRPGTLRSDPVFRLTTRTDDILTAFF